MDENRLPSLLLNIMLAQVRDAMGRRSLNMLLRQADLPQYIDHAPPLDNTPSITVHEYSRLLADIYYTFGARAAQPILLRGGRLGAAELRRQQPARFALTSTAVKLLPIPRRMRIMLENLVEQGEEIYGASYRLQEKQDAFFLDITACPYCAEIARRSQERNSPVSKPVCHIPVAIIDEMMEWATGQKHLVEETACIAQGAPACRIRIGK